MGTNSGHNRPLSVNHRWLRGLGVAGTVIFLCIAIFFFYTHQSTDAECFLILVVLSLIPFLVYGTTEMDEQTITSQSLIGRYRIKWSEVKRIEMDDTEGGIVFKGDNKQLVIPGRFFWSGLDKAQMSDLFDQQVKARKLDVKRNFLAAYVFSKNTRV